MSNLPITQLMSDLEKITKDRTFMGRYRGQVNRVFNAELKVAVEREHLLAQVMDSSLDTKKKLHLCSIESLARVLPIAARSGLSLDPQLGHLYLIPYGKEATVKLGYKGILHLAHQSSTLLSLNCQLRYEGDTYEETHTSAGPDFIFKPKRGKARGEIWGSFCHATFQTDMGKASYLEYVSIDEAMAVAADTPAWRYFKGQMVRKFNIRRGSTYWPKDNVLAEMAAVMDEFDDKIDFETKAESSQPSDQYVIITDDQYMTLHTQIYDFLYSRNETTAEAGTLTWEERLADKYTCSGIKNLPSDLFDDAMRATQERMTAIEEKDTA